MVNALAGLHLNPSDYEPVTAERRMMTNLRPTIAHVNQHWKHRLQQDRHAGIVTYDDLISEASEILWKAANEYPAWATERQLDPHSGAIFWAYARKAIDWGLANYLQHRYQKTDTSLEKISGEDNPDDWASDDIIRTQLSRHRPASMLHEQIADQIIMTRRDWRILIALRYFEELPYEQIGKLTDMSQDRSINYITEICGRIREHALTLVAAEPRPPITPRKLNIADTLPELEQYIWRRYGTDTSTWLGWVAHCYRQDVSYITDLLQHGNIIRAFGKIAHNRSLTDEQVRDIRRRTDAGEGTASIAASLNTSMQVVQLIKAGKTYVDVA
ncbi:hypothetical protein QMG83_14485 [Salinibacterium sp. G-O1]|uniref:hypothetical protein n=1 Tax=Salinibacterium sp. G-O1 TaxID=3046208 RepID=UPI0024BB6DA5|nr:hypothetical protein [Salinibacterium sp. G-O1]MDJ0336431.1 hypothetical protein [Salinibacterium sp. G-O1]